jgi:antitoxin (DNA-binding transcriptional repressor) of toxin-antitoxin stability system
MSILTVDDVRRDPSRLLNLLDQGEQVTLTRDGKPVAEVKPVVEAVTPPRHLRPHGLAAGEFTVPDSFFEPLPDDILKAFNCEE